MPSLLIENLIIKDNDKTLVNLLNANETLKVDSSLPLIGQSGSGKSLTLKTILNMLPSNLNFSIDYKSDFDLSYKNIGFIPQNPFTSLSPMTKIYKNFFDKKQIDKLLELVDIDINLKYKFPSQLSGGQLQRIIIAIALGSNPKLLLLDEPTTALDIKSKQNILDLIKNLQKKLNFIIIFVSHDIESIKNLCTNIAILKNGMICEMGKTDDILNNPVNSYTKQLINSNFKNREFRI
jgi:peptide/nickel transport system ATP-binding protein